MACWPAELFLVSSFVPEFVPKHNLTPLSVGLVVILMNGGLGLFWESTPFIFPYVGPSCRVTRDSHHHSEFLPQYCPHLYVASHINGIVHLLLTSSLSRRVEWSSTCKASQRKLQQSTRLSWQMFWIPLATWMIPGEMADNLKWLDIQLLSASATTPLSLCKFAHRASNQ